MNLTMCDRCLSKGHLAYAPISKKHRGSGIKINLCNSCAEEIERNGELSEPELLGILDACYVEYNRMFKAERATFLDRKAAREKARRGAAI